MSLDTQCLYAGIDSSTLSLSYHYATSQYQKKKKLISADIHRSYTYVICCRNYTCPWISGALLTSTGCLESHYQWL